jgi:hypothetical protein
MTKIAGSGSGSISQRHGSADPDPHQNVIDPEHCKIHCPYQPEGIAWTNSYRVWTEATFQLREIRNHNKDDFSDGRRKHAAKSNYWRLCIPSQPSEFTWSENFVLEKNSWLYTPPSN